MTSLGTPTIFYGRLVFCSYSILLLASLYPGLTGDPASNLRICSARRWAEKLPYNVPQVHPAVAAGAVSSKPCPGKVADRPSRQSVADERGNDGR